MLINFDVLTKKYKMNICGILHIGAHKCEELKRYKNYGLNNNQIIWVEGNPKLVKYINDLDNTIIIKNFICCDTDEDESILNISSNGESSSILELGTHKKYYPHIKYIDTVRVKNKRIDTMYKEDNLPNEFANFLNIDIQGAELLALKGMGNLINNFDYIYLEVNKEYVYQNCALVNEIDEYLLKFDFKRVETQWHRDNWGDALYIKK
jgi:FkbM family methyltransferase